MKKILFWSVLALVVIAVTVAAILFFTLPRLKTVDNEYLTTLDGRWDGARDFSEGMAAVKLDGKWGFIDTNGTVVISPKYDGAYSFSEGLAAVQSNGKWGYIDKTGAVVIPFTYAYTYAFQEGLAVYGQGNYYGYLNKEGKAITNAVYSEASSFQNGIACVKKDGKYGFIDKEGNALTEFVYGGKSEASEELIPVFYADSSKTINTGYLGLDGKQVLDFLWYDAKPFSEGLAAACNEYTKPYGFIDKTGTFVIAPAWDSVESFQNGIALVTKDRVHTYIDKTGKQITPKTYQKAYSFTDSGLARIAVSSATGWNFGFIDKNGNEVIAPIYAVAMDFDYGYARVSNGKKWGFINQDGVEISGMKWTEVGSFTEEGIARVQSGEVCGFVKLK